MTLNQLEYFCAVAEEKSISAAARRLHVAQPPISRQIAQLENELGVQLFLRGNKGMALTEAGQSLYQQSREIFRSVNTMVDQVRNVSDGMSGRLGIGIIFSTIPFALRHIRAYHDRYPQVELHIRMGTPQDLLEELNRGNLNVLFLRRATGVTAGLHERILGEDSLELIMTPELDPAPELPDIPVERLRSVPMCPLRSDDLWGYDDYLLKECQRNGFTPRVVCQCYDTPMAMQMVLSGFGVCFLPRSILETHPSSCVYAKPWRGLAAKSYAVLAWKDDVYRSACARRFTEL